LGLIKKRSQFTPVQDLKNMADFQHRIPLDNWWLKLRPLLRIMAKHETTYIAEEFMEHLEEFGTGDKITA
jgi:6-phosphofructokinase 1